MSNFGQAALTIVGTGVGAFFGNPQLGYLLGNLAGQALFPTQLPDAQGPRLNDLAVQSSAIGAPIPIVYGTYAVAGNVIWSSGLIETATTEEVGGKGGPQQEVTTYSYRASFAIGICEGIMGGLVRIWADAKVIYDRRPQQDGESDDAYAARVAASDATEAVLAFYSGDEAQEPDPTIEGYEGADEVPAFRGLCYVVLTDFQLADYGNRIPNFRFEVYSEGARNCDTVTEYAQEVLYPWLTGADPVNPANDHDFVVHATGESTGDSLPGTYSTEAAALAAVGADRGKTPSVYVGYRTKIGSNAGALTIAGGAGLDEYDALTVLKHYAYSEWDIFVPDSETSPLDGIAAKLATAGLELGMRAWHNGAFAGGYWSNSGAGVYTAAPYAATGYPTPEPYDLTIAGTSELGWSLWLERDAVIRVTRKTQAPLDPCDRSDVYTSPNFPGYAVTRSGELLRCGAWERVTGTFRVLQGFLAETVAGRTVVTKYPLGPARPLGHAEYDSESFWAAAYEAAVARGDMDSGLVYGVDYPEAQGFAYRREYEVCSAGTEPVTLGSIVEDLCARAGLTAIDVSELTKEVRGYVVSRVTTARAAIEPLRSFGFFDAAESGELVKFPVRGRAPLRTLTTEDLAAHESGSTRPTAVQVERQQDVELPRVLRLHYANPERDYEPGEQKASRLTTDAVNAVDVELVLAMSDDEAAQIAEVLLYDAWVGRNTYRISVDHTFLEIDPADVLIVPVDGQAERLRIVGIDHSLMNLLRLELKRDDDGTYTSYAVGAAGAVVPAGIVFYGPTELVLLDLPALRDADDDAGYYAALRPRVRGSTWRGAVIFRSVDSGASWQQVATATGETPMGRLVTALASGPSTIFDEGNEILLSLENGSLESRTEEAILNGANAAAIGAHGRWEVIQFRTATLDGDYWRLSGLLRGRRGTEHNIGTSEAGDRFVLLSAGTLIRVPLDNSAIGAERQLVAISIGTAFDPTDAEAFTGNAVALKPFSPVQIEAYDAGGGDVLVRWVRRDRLSQELRDGAEIPMSEATESYDVEIYDGKNLVGSASAVTTTEATIEVRGVLAEDFALAFPITYVQEIGGSFVGVYQGGTAALRELDADGNQTAAVGIGDQCFAFVAIGDDLFVGSLNGSDTAYVRKYDRTTLGAAPSAEYTATADADPQGLAYDGSLLWVSEFYTGQVRPLDPADLTAAGSPVLLPGDAPGAMVYASGSLYVCCRGSDQIVVIDTAGAAESDRFDCVTFPMDVVLVGSRIFVQGSTELGVYELDGTPVVVHTLQATPLGPQKLAYDGERVVGYDAASSELVFLNATTGEIEQRFASAGEFRGYAGGVYFMERSSTTVGDGYTVTRDTSGTYRIDVYQRSAIVGRGYAGSVTLAVTSAPPEIEIPGEELFAANRILLPLTADASDVENVLDFQQRAAVPCITDRGLRGDKYQNAVLATASGSPGFPSWLAADATGPLTIRASVTVYDKSSTADADWLAAVGMAASSVDAKLAIVTRADGASGGSVTERCVTVAAHVHTAGGNQYRPLFRNQWRYQFRWPELTSGGYQARPQGIIFSEDGRFAYVTAHYEDQFSKLFKVRLSTLEVAGSALFPSAQKHNATLARRASDGSYWSVDYTTGELIRFDPEDAVTSGTITPELSFDMDGLTLWGCIEWYTSEDGDEYLLAAEYRTSGTPYLYVFAAATITDGGTFNAASRVKRLVMPTRAQGIALRDGDLFISCSSSGGPIEVIDFEEFFVSGSDGANYSTYSVRTHFGPARLIEDLAFDASGDLWTLSEGYSTAVGDDEGFLAVWSSPLEPVENTVTLEYDGAGTVTIKVNDQLFGQSSWTPDTTPDAVIIGGRPTGAPSLEAGNASAHIRNVVIQDEAIGFSDPFGLVSIGGATVVSYGSDLVNGDAETGDSTGWTVELGELAVRSSNPLAYGGTYYFTGGTAVSSRASQRIDLLEVLEVTADVLDAADVWAIAEWDGARFGDQGDTHQIGFRWLDEDGVEISEQTSQAFNPSPGDFWHALAFGADVPAGARFVDVTLRMVRITGSNNDGWIDNLRVNFYRR